MEGNENVSVFLGVNIYRAIGSSRGEKLKQVYVNLELEVSTTNGTYMNC